MHNKTVIFTFSLVCAVMLAGCAAPGPKFSGLQNLSSDSSELIIYRKSAIFAFAQSMPLFIDGRKVGELYNSSYFQQQLSPGQHVIRVDTGLFSNSVATTVQIVAGKRKFLHFDFPTGLFANTHFIGVTIEERSVDVALDDLKELSSAKEVVLKK